MRFAIIADIHSNLEALETVLDDIKKQKCDQIVCLGDIVGYNADPRPCLQIIRDLGIPCVKGNHDEYCATDAPLDDFNPYAAQAVLWTRNQLTEDDKRWLRELRYVRLVHSFTIVHSTLDAPERWGYVFDKFAAASSFPYQTTNVCFFGHTHVPLAFMRDSTVRGGTYSKFKVDPTKKYLVNVCAVGQPRDNNPKAGYVIYDTAEATIELRRVEYDIAKAQRKIIDAGLPERLAERLAYGK